MGTGNKYRVYVAVHFQDYKTSNPEQRSKLQHAAYHWAIYIDRKAGITPHIYDVKQTEPFANIPGSGGWQYNIINSESQNSRMLCQIMIGKIPPDVQPDIFDVMLAPPNVPLPRHPSVPIENCVSWLRDAIAVLQRRGFAEKFDIAQFMDKALNMADEAYRKNQRLDRPVRKYNYTDRPI